MKVRKIYLVADSGEFNHDCYTILFSLDICSQYVYVCLDTATVEVPNKTLPLVRDFNVYTSCKVISKESYCTKVPDH
jgi:hypothetical protein